MIGFQKSGGPSERQDGVSLYWSRLSETGVFWGVLVAFVVGIPLFIYGNVINKPAWIVGASAISLWWRQMCFALHVEARIETTVQ
jgi:hypothetical protein